MNADMNNIVKMQQFHRRLTSESRSLLKDLEARAQDQLTRLLKTMLDKADDALFELANRADSNRQQQLYFDAMRDIRLKRKLIEQGYRDARNRQISAFAKGNPWQSEHTATGASTQNEELELSLIRDDDMEESLAIANMAARAQRDWHDAIYALTMRLRVITENDQLQTEQQPYSPAAIAGAFGETIEPLDIELDIKIIIYKLFDKYVMSHLENYYQILNQYLIERNILPKIRHVAPTPASASGGPAVVQATPANGATSGMSSGAHVESSGIHQTGAGQQTVVPAGGVAFTGQGFSASPGMTVVNALSGLQEFVMDPQVGASLASPTQIGLQALDLSRQVASHSGQIVPADEEKTISMVSLIFEYILEDQTIPMPIKTLLARLQIPMVKVALLDREFFTRKKHPARHLLNSIARASMGWEMNDNIEQDSLYRQVSGLVKQVLTQFDDDIELFEDLQEEFDLFLQEEENRSRIFEERAKKTSQGKDRVEKAKQRVQSWIDLWLNREEVPNFIQDFIRQIWRNTLMVTMLQEGEDSEQWQTHVRTINTLMWSLSPDKNAAEREKLVAVLPSLLKFLRQGMEASAVHPATIGKFFETLARHHVNSVNGGIEREARLALKARRDGQGDDKKSTDSFLATVAQQQAQLEQRLQDVKESACDDSSAPDTQDHAQLENMLEEIVIQAPAQADEDPSLYEDEYVIQARDLKVDQWVEFVDAAGQVMRAKLSWRSEETGNCLFVNRKGTRVAEKSIQGLATELRCDRARIVEDVPLMDKALGALKGFMKG